MSKRGIDQISGNDASGTGGGAENRRFVKESMAVQACDQCRQKKSRCDEDLPRCGACSKSGVECHYSERRLRKRENEIRGVVNSIRRLEAKIEALTSTVAHLTHPPATESSQSALLLDRGHRPPATIDLDPSQVVSPSCHGPSPAVTTQAAASSISFSQHAVAKWPAVLKSLPRQYVEELEKLPSNYPVELERSRPALSSSVVPFPPGAGDDWLNGLPVRVVRRLADTFFSTFNGLFPVLDRTQFFSWTLGKALDDEFDCSIESTTTLHVLALGCLAVEGHREGDYALRSRTAQGDEDHYRDGFIPPDWYPIVTGEQHPGLRFFNEARKRMEFRTGSNNLQNCQVYLLCAFYYTQIIRPMDSYLMLHRAALCSLMTFNCSNPVNFDTWEGDMESRVFWCTLMYETILTQELGLPKSGLAEFEATVPLPNFRSFREPSLVVGNRQDLAEDDAFFHYHFLAQAANRIMITRIADSLYFYGKSDAWRQDDIGELPSRRITAELVHQLDQWLANLPKPLQFDDTPMISRPLSPGHAIAEALLRSRNKVARFAIGRPYLFKALHNPSTLTDGDLQACRGAWEAAMDWPMLKAARSMVNYSYPIASRKRATLDCETRYLLGGMLGGTK